MHFHWLMFFLLLWLITSRILYNLPGFSTIFQDSLHTFQDSLHTFQDSLQSSRILYISSRGFSTYLPGFSTYNMNLQKLPINMPVVGTFASKIFIFTGLLFFLLLWLISSMIVVLVLSGKYMHLPKKKKNIYLLNINKKYCKKYFQYWIFIDFTFKKPEP